MVYVLAVAVLWKLHSIEISVLGVLLIGACRPGGLIDQDAADANSCYSDLCRKPVKFSFVLIFGSLALE